MLLFFQLFRSHPFMLTVLEYYTLFAKSLRRKRGMKVDQGSFRLDIIVGSLWGVIRLKFSYTVYTPIYKFNLLTNKIGIQKNDILFNNWSNLSNKILGMVNK